MWGPDAAVVNGRAAASSSSEFDLFLENLLELGQEGALLALRAAAADQHMDIATLLLALLVWLNKVRRSTDIPPPVCRN